MTTEKHIDEHPVWTVIANIVHERAYGSGRQEIRKGTKHFRPGTKVYIIDWFPGVCENIVVVGLARKPRRFIKIVIRVDWVENLRVKLCYDPAVIKKIYDHHGEHQTILTEEFVTNMCKTIPYWQKELISKNMHDAPTKAKSQAGLLDKLKHWFS